MMLFDEIRTCSKARSVPDFVDEGRSKAGDQKGFGLVGAVVISTALLVIAMALATVTLSNYRYQHRAYLSAKATAIAEAGADKAIYNLNQPGSGYTGETGTSFGGGVYDVSIANPNSTTKVVTVTARVDSGVLPLTRKVKVTLSGTPSDQVAFNYGVQVGTGGIDMSNSSKLIGNVYANGNVVAHNTAQIVGDVWISGATGTLRDFTAGAEWGVKKAGASDGNAHAHSIIGSEVQGNAYYQSISGSTVGGTSFPGSADPPPTTFPISDQQITDWKDGAAAGGSQGTLSISSGTTNLGPKKISGNLALTGTAVLNLTGVVWVTGSILVANSAIVQIDSSFGDNGTVLIGDGLFDLKNSSILRGSGDPKSFLLSISTSNGDPAFDISNSSKNDILYAPNGWINVNNSIGLREVTGYGLRIKNTATVTYDTGLALAEFSSGPGGRWTVTAWQEVK